MAEKKYIECEAAIFEVEEWHDMYPDSDAAREALSLVKRAIRKLPAADVRPVVLCKDCVYWQKPQVKLNDGTYRDYEPDEYENGSLFGGVTVDVGINIGSFCAKYNTEHQNRIPQFMGENDFCSKGYKLREES